MTEPAKIEPQVRAAVRALLTRSPSFRQLPDDDRRRLSDGMAAVGTTLAIDGHDGKVALPGFVAELVEGTFQAVVDASVQQMKAYADLLEQLAEADVPIIRDRMGKKLSPARIGLAGAKIKWPP